MGVRATCTHITSESNQTIRVDLIGASYGGASREVTGAGANWLRFAHDQLDYSNIFNTVVQRGRLDFSFHVKDATDKQVIDDVLASNQGEYTLAYYIGGTLQWIGEVMMDQLGQLSSGEPYPYTVTLTARDFVPLEGQLFPIEDNRQLISTVLGRLLNATGYDLPIWTHTSWTESNITEANDFLRQLYIETRNLRDYSKEGDLQITYLEALTRVVAPFKAIIKQTNGVFVIDQLSAFSTPSSVLRTIYDKDGVYQSQSTVNPTVSANGSVTVVRGSIDEIKPGYKRATVTYNHRTPNSDISFLPDFTITPINPTSVVGTEYVEEGVQIILTSNVTINYSTPINVVTAPYVPITIQHGSLYWNNDLAQWQSTSYTNQFAASDSLFGVDPVFGVPLDSFRVVVNIRTTPTQTSDDLIVTLAKTPNPNGSVTASTRYVDTDFVILGDDDLERNGEAISYTLEQSGSFTQNYNGGVYYFGNGPTTRSASAIRYSASDFQALTTNWKKRGTSDSLPFHTIALKEIMDHYRSYGRIGSYILKDGTYTPINILVYDSKAFYYVGGQFDGYTGWWTPIVFELALATGTDALVTGIVSGPSILTSTALSASFIARNQSIEAGGRVQYRLASQITSGTSVTQVILTNTTDDPFLFETGDKLLLVHPVTLVNQEFDVSTDQAEGSNVVAVTASDAITTYPVGSFVFLSETSINAAILFSRNAILRYARGSAHGELTGNVTGNVSSITANLWARIRAGEDFVIQDNLSGEEYYITAAESVDAGLRTFAIEPTIVNAVTGSYIQQDGSQKQSYIYNDPGTIQLGVERIKTKNAIAVLSTELSAGPGVVSLPITGAITINLLDNQVITVQNRAGQSQDFVVNGDQIITGASSSITVDSVTNLYDFESGDSVFEAGGLASARITINSDEIDLRVSFGNVINAINISTEGILIQGNRIRVNGDVTFASGYDPSDTRYVAYQSAAPVQRPSGDALVTGDEWFDTDEGNRLRTWNGSAWITTETQISGGRITTGTVDADLVTISADGGGVLINASGITGSSGATAFSIDSSGIRIGQAGNLLAVLARNYINFQTDAVPTEPEAEYSVDGWELYNTAADVNPRVSASVSGIVLRNASFSTSVDIDGSNGRVTAFSLVVGTQTNKATIEYTTNTARTLTIPNVSGNRTFAFINEAQTFTANQTVSATLTANTLVVGTQANKATIEYTTNTARTLTIPNVGGNRTFAFINQAQTFSTAQAFSALATFQSGIELVGSGANVTIVNLGTATRTINIPTLAGTRTMAFIDQAQTWTNTQNFTGTLQADSNTGQTDVIVTSGGTLTFTKGLLTGVS